MKKILMVSLVLALMVTLCLPAAVIAEKPASLDCMGMVSHVTDSFEEGTLVAPAGQSGQWRIITRDIYGTFSSGPLAGADFALNYKGVVDFPSQKGNIHGTLTCGDFVFEVNGKTAGAVFYALLPDDFPVVALAGAPLYELALTGQWTCLKGAWGTGVFEASIKFVPTPDRHIAWVNPYISSCHLYNK